MSSGRNQTASVSTASVAATGRAKNADNSPSDLIMDVMKFSSSMPPRTTPGTPGAIGKPFSSSTNAITPATSITVTSNAVLLMANDPTTQKSMMTGISTVRGTLRICFDTLMHHQPSGIMMMLAMMNSR